MRDEIVDYQEVDISRAKHYEPKVLQKYKANKAKAENHNTHQPVEAIEADVWQLIQQHLDNAQDIARMNSMIRVLFS